MPQYPLVVFGVTKTPQYLPQLMVSLSTPVLPLIFSYGPWAAVPPWVGPKVKGHPYTPTKFLLGPVGSPNTSLS